MDKAGRITPLTVLGCCAIVAAAYYLVAPMFRARGNPMCPDCESNMKQIGTALRMYAQDNHDCYPPNCRFLPNGKLGPICIRVKLTPLDPNAQDDKPFHYKYGAGWVDAIRPYMEAITKDSAGAMHCTSAGEKRYPSDSKTARVTYAFNRNLIEQPEGIVQTSASLMAVRELDRLVDSELRPTNCSTARPDLPPDSPFLTARDSRIGATRSKLHEFGGSNILFADGHVKRFGPDYFPTYLTRAANWDPETAQWWNIISPTDPRCQSIAITP
jgi:prepilin-type processing-associated H-X9-DG protein